MLAHRIVDGIVGHDGTLVVVGVVHNALVPIASACGIRTVLFVPGVDVVGITPFVGNAGHGQNHGHASQFHIAELLQIQFSRPFIHDVPDIDGGIELGALGTLAHLIDIVGRVFSLIQFCLCTQEIRFCQTEQVQVGGCPCRRRSLKIGGVHVGLLLHVQIINLVKRIVKP